MHAWKQPHVPALTIGAIIALTFSMFATFGIGGVLVLALAGLLVGNHLAHRNVVTQPEGLYPRHGDNMD